MAARIRTLNFLPEVFRTPTNAQFLGATLDQIVDQPNTMRIQGYIGTRFGYGINAKDNYVVEPTKTRTDYQLDPGVVFTKTNTSTATDFVTYPGIIDALKLNGGVTNNNDRLFNSQFYSWDPFVDLDKLINFNQYYWLPQGAPAVTIATDIVYNAQDYTVVDDPNAYIISSNINPNGSANPTLTLIRGGTYSFTVNQDSPFWIQGQPGVTGYDPNQPNLLTRDVLGVSNNGAYNGVVEFTVPYKNAQDEYNFPGDNRVDVVSSAPFDSIEGQLLSAVVDIDGVTALEGLTVMFYNTGVVNETGFVGQYYDTTLYDEDGGAPYVFPGSSVNDNNFGGGYYTEVPATFYTITYVGDPTNPVIKLVPASGIPTNEKITPNFGTQWKARNFYRNVQGVINLVPYLSSLLDTLYYQDGTVPNKVGQLRLINSNITNQINVLEILGKSNYTAPNGVVFTNGLKVTFNGDIFPTSYKTGEYYVQGVGTAIELINTQDLIVPESFTEGTYNPWDILPWDIGNYDVTLYIPVQQDYITIARNSIDRNPWSRSNRWFHIDVINATATYNNDPSIATTYATQYNKAKRPVIEFYPNLKLFDNCIVGKQPVDFFDVRTTDAFTQVAGQPMYYPDVEVYTSASATVNGVTGTSTTITIPASAVSKGAFQVGQFITDSDGVIPRNSQITAITGTTLLTITVGWTSSETIPTVTNVSLVANDISNDNYALYDGARIIFSVDTDAEVRNKIYVVRFSNVDGLGSIITLTEADDGLVLQNEGTVAYKGYYNQGKDFYYYFNNNPAVLENQWQQAQQKTTVNQAPFFDVFDTDGISFGDTEIYTGSSFKGNKLFSYGIGSGINDIVLGFPLRYSSVNNVGDISFDVPLNSATFDYVRSSTPITQQVNTGYVHNYSDIDTLTRALGWQTAVAESRQYQIFSFDYVGGSGVTSYTCDIAAATDTVWPNIQVYLNNVLQDTDTYTYTINPTTTVVNFTVPDTLVDTVVEITLLSDQVSATAYYQVPNNLQNNPFNADITTANVGDIRGQYQSIFYNNPNTTGKVFGANNYRDLGNLVPWGNRIIQNSASLVLPATFLRKPGVNLYDSLQYNSNQYISFKTLLVDTVNQTEYNVYQSPATMLDDALDQITISKVDTAPFFWSDMLPSKSPYASNSYTFANSLDVSRYPLTRIYNFDTANYYGVLVYLTRTVSGYTSITQLVSGVDYTISTTSPALTVETDLLPGDIITVNEYYQTYGSYVPNTPTKLGLYPSFIPEVVLDENYTNPTYFIRGHDGSYTKLYGDYIDGNLVDFRDKVLLEFETRIYNNLKLSNIIPVRDYDVVPGFFRTTDYSYDEFLSIYSQFFLNWVGQNRVEYKQQVGYTPTNEFSYNYSQSGNKINNAQIQQGYWRGIYQYFYDTSQPDVAPWEMIGLTSQPTWWTTRYGPAPYTSDNLVLWGDLAAGINWNNGNPIVVTQCIRPQLLQVLPVDSEGNLVSPFVAIVGNYDGRSFRNDWKVGDVASTEFAYRRSSSWPFDLMKILALTKPANFYNLGVDVDNYKYNEEFNQFLVNDRSHLVIADVEIYGSGTAKTSYINWIVDFEKQVGIDSTQTTTDLLDNLDVRLIYRVAGFTDKALVNFYVEKGSPNSNNASLLIPTESLDVLLYDNIPFNKIIYSGIIVQNAGSGWKVFGNSQTKAYFTISKPKINGNYNLVSVEGESVQVAKDYFENTEILVPYGTEFVSKQDLAQFIASYGNYLTTQGVLFDQIESGLDINWNQMVAEYLYWTQSGWGQGSLINLNPAANLITIQKDSCVVQPLTLQRQNFILNQNLYPIQAVDLSVIRDDTLFSATPLNQGDTVAYGQFNISNFEHGVVFNNVTLFNDVIYNLITGLRQNRITARGTKTADWNGTIDAQGFILNQDNIQEWNNVTKYTKGSIVKYKNKYWVSLRVLEPSMIFDSRYWKETDYNEIQKGLLPNPSTRSFESTLYYNTNTPNLSKDADLLSWSLIGYRPRDYMALADLTDITQVNVYKNLIKEKGTRIATENFKGITLPQGGIDYEVYENWAIKTGEFGGVLDNNFVDFRLNQNQLTGNPSIVGLTTGTYTEGVQQEVPLYSVFNYGRPITNPNILPTLPANTPNKLYPDAGYVNFNDITTFGYYYNDLNLAQTPLSQLYVGQYVWVADYNGTWQVYTPIANGNIIQVLNNLNGTVTLEFAEPHGLTKYQTIAIINFNDAVNGYRIVQAVVDNYKVTIALSLVSTITRLTSTNSIVMRFQSQRVTQPSDIINLPLLNTEFVKNKVWVDTGTTGDWEVYRKSINYNLDLELLKTNSETFGSAVATTSDLGYLVGDAELGVAYRYTYNPVFKRYDLVQTLFSDTLTAGSLVIGDNYQIVTLGNTDFVALGATSNLVGTRFTATGTGSFIAGSFVVNNQYTITSVGTTDFTLIGASANTIGITFTATGVGSGTGTAVQGSGQAGLFMVSYGSSIGYAGSTFAISQPTGTLLADRKVKIYNLVTNTTVNELQLLQTIQAPTGITNWGTKTEFSGDSNWLFISAYEQNQFYVYRKSQITGLYEYSNIITLGNLAAGDNFSFSLATNYYGNTVVVGAPGVDTGIINNTGTSYIFERVMQNFEAQFTSQILVPQTFSLVFTPGTRTFTGTTITSNAITLNSVAGLSLNMPVIFTGLVFGGLAIDQVYYIKTIVGSTITLSLTIGGSTLSLVNGSGTMTMVAQTEPLFISVNGTLIATNNYAVIGSTLNVYQSLNAGDILTASGSTFVLLQQFTATDTVTIGEQYGYSADLDTYGNELLIGSPFQINSQNKEGTIYRYTDGGGSYGIITGTIDCQVTTLTTILLNGYAVAIPIGNASVVAAAIEASNITNITATSIDNKLVISLINIELAMINDKLDIVTLSGNTLYELGISKYTLTQVITDPHPAGRTQFGTVIKFNDNGSFVASAPVAPRYEATTFDSTDDDNYNNDTLFDNNTTQFVDTLVNAGAVYMFDYAENYNENLLNVGQYIYAQSVNALNINYGAQPYYGTAIDFNDNTVVVGTPGFRPGYENGQVIIYTNTSGLADWSVYRQPEMAVNVNGITNAQLYSASTNNTLINLDYIDPLQGKILGVVAENLDIVSNADPASYNSPNTTVSGSAVWGTKHLGKLWFNTSTTKFVNYHQNDEVVYNSKWWGRVFPGSQVTIYSWITSNVVPAEYTGPGTPLTLTDYSVEYVLNSTGAITPVYFFWARNTNIIFNQIGKTLSDTICESYISVPQASGIAYFAPIQSNVMGLYNTSSYVNSTDTVMHIGFATGTNEDDSHSIYSLIRANYPDDFLPGLPALTSLPPLSLYDRMLDSMSGVDESGAIVPDPYLPKPVQSGILVRPRQSFFYSRFGALKNYLTLANQELAKIPFTETQSSKFLYTIGPINPSTGLPFYNTTDYWDPVNWWATGYNDNTKSAILVESYYQLATINAQNGLIVTVNKNGAGFQETYRYDSGLDTWERIGLQDGTIQFKTDLWDYETARLGFGDNFFDTTPFDTYPSEETRSITRFLNEELPSEIFAFRNQGLILLFNYIISETIESQNYLPWLNKTSFIDVAHTIRELLPLEVFQSDNQDFLAGYINEVKPYHVVVKDFLFKYTGVDVWAGDITDFDLPAQYNTSLQQYITPELVYANPSGDNQYIPTDAIWQDPAYTNWFNNYGVSITGVNGYPITVLSSYLTLNSNSMVVDNIYGFPINGTIKVYDPNDPETDLSKKAFEIIAYSSVDRAYGTLNGLTRGVNETTISNHLPGQQIYIDLPAVLVLDGGRGYANPPVITAYIDTTIYPAPRREAILQPVMNLDQLLRVDVVDPGDGYVVLPQIIIEPSSIVTFATIDVDTITNTITIQNQLVQTGDLVRYYTGSDTTPINGVKDGQYYYVGVLENVPTYVIALYTTYADALQDHDRVVFLSAGSGTNNNLAISARASCVTSSQPIRENITTLRYDRTTYDSQVTEWTQGNFYGSFYAGSFQNTQQVASSSLTLFNETPAISTILASAQGATFEIQSIRNDEVIEWSSRTRIVTNTTVTTNVITIAPSIGGAPDEGFVGPTTGFYVGMPIKFAGAAFGGITVNTVYYVKEIVSLTQFSLVDGNGADVILTTASTTAGLDAIIGEVTNTAVVTIQYPGILTTTATQKTTNFVTIPLNPSGICGTTGFYTGIPIFFIGDVFGGVIENEEYYVTTVIDDQTFTMSLTNTPTIVSVTETTAPNLIKLSSIGDLEINTPIIVTGTTFGGIVAGQLYYIADIAYSTNQVTLSNSINGGAITVTNATGTATLTSQADVVQLTTATGTMTCNVGLPISPGQITGQEFTFYNTSGEFTNSGLGYSSTVLATALVRGQQYQIQTIGSTDFTLVGAPSNNVGVVFTASESGTGSGTAAAYSNLITRGTIATVATSNYLYLNSLTSGTTGMYVDMPFRLSAAIGGLSAATTYYVLSIGTIVLDITSSNSGTDAYTCASTTGFYSGMPISFTGGVFGGVVELVTYYVKTVASSTTFTISETPGGATFDLFNDNGLMTLTADNPFITVSTSAGGSVVSLTNNFSAVSTLTQYPTVVPTFFISYILGGYSVVINTPGLGFAYNNNITIPGSLILGGTTGINDIIINVSGISTTGEITSTIVSGTPPGLTEQYYLKVISPTELEVYSNPNLTVPVDGDTLGAIYTGVKSTTVTALATPDITTTSTTGFEQYDPVVFTGTVAGNIVLGQTYYIKTITPTLTISETLNGTTFDVGTASGTSFTMAKSGDYVYLPEPFYFNQSIVRYNNRLYQCIISNNDTTFILGKWELLDSGDRRLNELDRIVGYYNPTVNMPGRDLTQLVTGITYPGSVYMGNAFPPAEEFLLDTNLQDQPFYPATINNMSVVWDGNRYVTISTSPTYSALLTSATGDNWTLSKLSNNPVGLSDIYYDGTRYVITTTNSATPIYTSTNGLVYTTGPSLNVPSNTLSRVYNSNNVWIAVGENVVTSIDTISWVNAFTLSSPGYFSDVTYTTAGYTGWLVIGNQTNNGVDQTLIIRSTNNGITWDIVNDGITTDITSAYVNAITSSNNLVVIVGDAGQIFTSIDGTQTNTLQTSGTGENLVDVVYGSGIFIAVGENGTIVTSTDGVTWNVRTSGTTNNLNSVAYNDTDAEFIVVGDNNTILTSSNGSTWTASALFIQEEPVYTVQGDTFTEGYGPEELVPGVVTDNLTMIVTTRPGTNWLVGEYGHTGFTVVTREITPSYPQTEYSFLNIVQNPAFLAVYDITPATGTSRRIYEQYDYTVDWVLKTITLNITLAPNHILGVQLYEVGNGDQLQRSNSQTVPFIDNTNTGFIEILLSCNYSANQFNGNGLIRPGTEPIQVECTETESIINSITCDDVSTFALNEPIRFQGDVFGGIELDQTYYIKTISYVTNKITVSLPPLVSGIAGPTFSLTDDTGSMQAIVQQGTGVVWTDPLVVHNGDKLVLGETSTVTQTKSSTNSIVVNTALTMDVNDPIVFSDLMFGGPTPHTTYYIASIIDDNEFTISATSGGSTFVLTDATGLASCITNDFAIAQADVGTTAKLMFAENYNQNDDFVTFAVFGETDPLQYAYSIPITQIYLSTGGETQLALTNYIGGTNPENAVVEVNGLRLTDVSDYTIDLTTQMLYLTFSLTIGDILAVTTYNSTERQYLNTSLGGTYSGSVSVTLNIGSSTHFSGWSEEVIAGGFIIGVSYQITSLGTTDFTLIGAASNTVGEIFTATGAGTGTGTAGVGWGDNEWSPGPDYFTLSSGSTSGLVVDTGIIFTSPIGGVTINTIYYIAQILSSTTFNVSLTPGGAPLTLISATGAMLGFVNPAIVSNITAINNVISAPVEVTNVSSATAPNTLTATSTTGFISASSGIYQPIIFKNTTGLPGAGGILTDGTVYWVDTVINSTDFTISETPGGLPVTVTGATGTMIAYVGGNPTTTITTGIAHNLETNNIVRIDGVNGSTQLNNNIYYVHKLSDTIIGLYLSPYLPESYQTNEIVTGVSNWSSSGYVWLDNQFTLIDATATAISSNEIAVNSTSYLVVDTPVYFSGSNMFGGIVAGTKYYIKSIDVGTSKITISTTYQGSELTLTNYSGTDSMGVTMWEQTNVDRVWVTVNGYKIPSSSLYLNPNNNLSILTLVEPGDVVVITNMIPTATPDELTYINNVNKSNIPTVYRATSLSTTWLTQPLSYTDSIIYVEDVTKITTNVVQNEVTPALANGVYTIGLDVDKRIISQVIVVNNTTSTTLPSSAYSVQIVDTAPVLEITSGVSVSQSLTITVILGNLIYVAGEQIKFTTVDFDTNTLTGLQRGTNGTGERFYIPAYEKVYGILSTNQLPAVNYNLTWNSYNYNPTLGDPLQISDTVAANFLNAEF
jgi:hypothetical protein